MPSPSSEALLHRLSDALPAFADREHADPEAYPDANLADLRDIGLPIAPFDPELGGIGMDLVEAVRAIEMLAGASGSTALILSMPLGFAGVMSAPVELAPQQGRIRFVRQAEWVSGEYRAGKLFAACNSEKGAGGSLEATKTTAARRENAFHLTGEKILASGGTNAGYFISTAKVPDLPGAGVVEFFLVPVDAPGVTIAQDWDGFGMRSTESHSVRYNDAPATDVVGFPDFITVMQPTHYWYHLFAAIPLGCVRGMLETMTHPAPTSPALRLRLAEATMRYEAMRAYLLETARDWRFASSPQYRARVLRTKTYVTQESARLAAELFALGGGRSYRRGGATARAFADVFAGTALRPPLTLALDTLIDQFGS